MCKFYEKFIIILQISITYLLTNRKKQDYTSNINYLFINESKETGLYLIDFKILLVLSL
jgi:hypothetical protein